MAKIREMAKELVDEPVTCEVLMAFIDLASEEILKRRAASTELKACVVDYMEREHNNELGAMISEFVSLGNFIAVNKGRICRILKEGQLAEQKAERYGNYIKDAVKQIHKLRAEKYDLQSRHAQLLSTLNWIYRDARAVGNNTCAIPEQVMRRIEGDLYREEQATKKANGAPESPPLHERLQKFSEALKSIFERGMEKAAETPAEKPKSELADPPEATYIGIIHGL